MKIENATFHEAACRADIDGERFTITGKLSLLQESLCIVQGETPAGKEQATRMNNTVHPDGEVMCCMDPRLVELAISWWIWANDPEREDWAETPAEVAPTDEIARAKIREHLPKLRH